MLMHYVATRVRVLDISHVPPVYRDGPANWVHDWVWVINLRLFVNRHTGEHVDRDGLDLLFGAQVPIEDGIRMSAFEYLVEFGHGVVVSRIAARRGNRGQIVPDDRGRFPTLTPGWRRWRRTTNINDHLGKYYDEQ